MQPDHDVCRISWCERERVRDTLYCGDHLNDAWANRVMKLSDGTYVVGAGPRKPAWVERMAKNSKDFTGARAA